MKTRFLKSVERTCTSQDAKLPWTRGKHRKAFIAKRTEHQKLAQQSA